jgi:sialic acid synthase SpsE
MTNTYVIAEMAYSHNGSTDIAKEIIVGAASAGADAISIHFTHMSDTMVRHYGAGPGRVSEGKDTKPIYDYIDEISLSFETWAELVAYARSQELDVVVMPNDQTSFEFAETQKPDAYVLSAACFEEYDFIREIGRTGRPIYLRVGGATLGEMETVINLIRAEENQDITLLYGHQNYPTGIEDTNLNFLSCLKSTFGLPVGIADHVDANDEFSGIAPLLAIPLGISCIEKHITHDRALKCEDFESALNPDELKLLIERIRKAERALGNTFATGLDESSALYRKNVRKRLVATRQIAAGEIIADDAIAAKRSDEGLTASYKDLVVGRVAVVDIEFDEGITLDILGPTAKKSA